MEGDKHLDLIVPFLKKENADVLSLEEMSEKTFQSLKKEFGMEGFFAPLFAKSSSGKFPPVGTAIMTRFAILEGKSEYYQKSDKGEINDNDPFFFEQLDHALISATISFEGKEYKIAATHFPKNMPGSEISPYQRKVFKSLLELLDRFSDIILCGDTNCPRGTELFDTLARRYKDNIPQSAVTTLDPTIHNAGFLPYVVDGMFTSPEYQVKNIRLQDGVSDHLAVIAEIERV